MFRKFRHLDLGFACPVKQFWGTLGMMNYDLPQKTKLSIPG